MIKFEIKNQHTAWLTLNNPTTSNSITYEMIDSLVSHLDQIEKNNQIRVVVITGEGSNFCSGGDLNNMIKKAEMFQGDSNELRVRYEQGIQRIPKAMDSFTKPIIAAVNGAAAGAGCDLTCMCDLRIGTDNSKFLESFVKIGLIPGDGGTFFLQRVIGFAKAMEMTLTGRTVKGSEALQMGLLNQLVAENDLHSATQKMADQIAANAPIAVQMAKKAMRVSYLNDLQTSLDLLAAYQGITQRTADHFEALRAIQEKRSPVFTGQ